MKNYNWILINRWGAFYHLNDKLHRIGGPAIEYNSRDKYWYQNGLLHRIDGPAIEWFEGDKEWFYEDQKIDCNSQEEFERYIKLKLFW
jgi:hypothetical protein